METINGYQRRWWKEAVVYQIYPRSFYDSNGDGIGDLRGILEKLPHIKGLGVDVIWLSPHFDSPNADNGYDIRDYRKVMAEFGTMQDFDDLLAAIKAAGLRLIIDLVVNHTSDEHAWFVESQKGPDNPYRDYYIWRPGDQPPNNWPSIFTGPAWTRDGDDWYLHLFAEKQPDLNWDNPAVRGEVYDLMRFWLDKGVDGFRMDVIPFISKDPALPDMTMQQLARPQDVYADGPRVHDYLQEMNAEVLAHYDVMTVGEAFGVSLAQTPALVDERRGELDMVFQFDAVDIDRAPGGQWQPWRLQDFKAIFTRHDQAFDRHCWPTVFLSNHDNPRIVSRYGDDSPEFREKSAMLFVMLLLTMKGTPFLYQGDELGLTNYPFEHVTQFDDVWVKNAWRAQGMADEAAFVANQNKVSRDHARIPMAWDSRTNGGFTVGKPWFLIHPEARAINAETQKPVYDFFARMIALRHRNTSLVYGDYHDLAPDHDQVFAYSRRLPGEAHLIVLNMSGDEAAFDVPAGDWLDGNYATPSPVLRGWEARVYRLA
ncbi:MAG: alpha-glucosidase [Asticcacaulis sp.]